MRPVTLDVAVENQGDGVRRIDGPWTGQQGLEHWRVTGKVRLAETEEESDRVTLDWAATCDGWPADVIDLGQRARFTLEDWLIEKARESASKEAAA